MKDLFNIFNPDNKIANFLTKIMYLAWLNFLWLLCSLPIVTIGASTTAVYYTAMRMARDDEGYIARDFFHSFKENFLQATGVWLIVLVFFGMICFNWWNLSGSPNDLLRIASHLFLSLFVIFALISIYFFPLLSQFDMRIMELLRCSLFISLKNIHWSICLVILLFGGSALMVLKFYPLVIFGFPLIAFLQSYIFNRIFRQYLPDHEFTPGSVAVMNDTK